MRKISKNKIEEGDISHNKGGMMKYIYSRRIGSVLKKKQSSRLKVRLKAGLALGTDWAYREGPRLSGPAPLV